MTRRRVAIALVPPPALSARIDALRRQLDDPRLGDLPTHLTLVPPIDLDPEAASVAAAALRAAASSVVPFELQLGPADSFAPRTTTLHLGVRGELDRLTELRESLRRAPWDRPDRHEFVPHVTLRQRVAAEQVDHAVALLCGALGEWQVESVHLLERLRPTDGPARWVAVAEEPLGGPRIVGRGGVELALRVGTTIEPAVAVLADIDPGAVVAGEGTQVLVAVAERAGSPGVPVGVALGRVGATGAVLDHLVVPGEHRRQGIARQVLGAWCDRALDLDAPTVVARRRPLADGADGDALAAALGFGVLDATTWCRRIGPLGELGSLR